MKPGVFERTYAAAYDTIYREKDYDAECGLIERIFLEHSGKPVRSVLDLGCGTGGHSLRLAARGYEVTGVDVSPHMLAEAKEKALGGKGQASFYLADIRDVRLDRSFDAALMMFAVLGYQRENGDVHRALSSARRHLRPGGLLVADVWYGPAVLAQRPSERVRVIPSPKGKVIRASSGDLDTARHLCHVHLRLWEIEGDRLVAETEEDHAMRYFFPREIPLFLEAAGFSLVRLGAFPDFGRDPDETTWNALFVARAV
ncbi:MAG: class I SAM-dependent methyltransferase [Methanomicrobiales archaeon]|nr:class I SAM-dependent methyltransferase [Methanomicrobiales archaeon]